MHRNNINTTTIATAANCAAYPQGHAGLVDRLAGKTYVTLIRQSDDTDGEQSVEAQQMLLDAYAARRQMVPANHGRIVLPGVTGSLPGNRTDLEMLLQRKRQRDDFDVILVQKIDRMTRGGGEHGFYIEWEFIKLGVEILYPGDNLPDGPYQAVIKMMKFESARDQASSTGQRTVQGQDYAMSQDRMAPFSHTPFGCWRLYLGTDNNPLHVIRSFGDGRQEKLDPHTLTLIDTLGQVGGGSKGHYKKQKHEKPFAVPGCQQQQEAVRKMLRWRWIDGIGGVRIAIQLNEMGIRSPRGKRWSQRMVESITENPIYCGRSVANMATQGLFYMRSASGPIAANLDQKTMATAARAPKRYRPPEDWFWRDEPFMADFLDEELRLVTETKVLSLLAERWDRRANGTPVPKGCRSRHKQSLYLLSGILTAVQDQAETPEGMIGYLSGPKQGPHARYYRHRKGKRNCIKDSVFNRMIPAEPLEAELMRVIREVLIKTPDLRATLIEKLTAAMSEARAVTPDDLEELRKRRDDVRKRRQTLARMFDEEAMQDIGPVMQELSQEARRLDLQLAEAEIKRQSSSLDPETVADEMIATLTNTAETVEGMGTYQLKQVMAAIVEEAKADLETKDVFIRLKLPDWAKMADAGPCLEPNSRSPVGFDAIWQTRPASVDLKSQALPVLKLLLAEVTCRYIHLRGSHDAACYQCTRRRKVRA